METIKNRKTIFGIIIFTILGIVVTGFLNLNTQSNNNSGDGTAGINVDNGDSKINWSKYPTFDFQLSDTITINQSGTYDLSGEIKNGSIIIDAGDTDGVVKLVLNNASIYCDDGPAIYVKSADDVVIETAKDSENTVSSGSVYGDFGDDNVNGTIYSKGDLTFSGDGYLRVESNFQDAIVSKDDLTIRSGEIDVSSADDGIRGKDSVNISGGKISISAKQDGIKSTNEDDKTKGFVFIEGGELNISVSDDGIHATTSLIISGGKINVEKSYEGLEGAKVVINDGQININSNDDGINVAGGNDESAFMRPGAQNFSDNVEYTLTINGGNLYVNATGDGLDSNGTIYINGGSVVVDGPTNSANGALDSERGIFLNGGSVIAVGASGMAESFNESSLQNSVSIFLTNSQTKDTEISIRDENGNEIISHLSRKSFSYIAFGSEELEFGKTYYIYLDDNKYDSFTVSSSVTTVGSDGKVMPGGGGGMTPPNGMTPPSDDDGQMMRPQR